VDKSSPKNRDILVIFKKLLKVNNLVTLTGGRPCAGSRFSRFLSYFLQAFTSLKLIAIHVGDSNVRAAKVFAKLFPLQLVHRPANTYIVK
jgi:hypothetical protein